MCHSDIQHYEDEMFPANEYESEAKLVCWLGYSTHDVYAAEELFFYKQYIHQTSIKGDDMNRSTRDKHFR